MPLVPNYVPTDWVQGVTPVDETRMDNIDTNLDQHADAINALDTRLAAEEAMPDVPTVVNGKWAKGVGGAMVWSDIAQADVAGLTTTLTGKQDTSAKGAANGYAGLDSSGKVPTAQLPAMSSTDLNYAGTWSAATNYKEGDIVIYNGVSYMALRSSLNETPQPWATGGSSYPALTAMVAQLAADASIPSSGSVDGPSLSLTAGTWLLICAFSVVQPSAVGRLTAKLWDGTTVAATVQGNGTASASWAYALSGIATLVSTATWKLTVNNATAQPGTLKAATVDNPAGNTATTLVAVRVG